MDNPINNKLNSNYSKFTPVLFPVFVFIIFFFLLLHIFFLYSPNKDALTTISTTLITLTSFFILGLFVTVIMRMKSSGTSNSKNVSSSFLQVFNSNLALLVVYVISLILVFSLFSSQTINKYAIYFLLATVIPGIFLFYKNIVQQSAIVYTDEKIRFLITMVSFIITMILFYHADPGGYIDKYFGITMLFTILLAVFGLLYMFTLFMLPDRSKNYTDKSSFFDDFKSKGFTTPSVLFTVAFLLYLILITIGITIYPGGISGFFKNKSLETAGIMSSIFVVLILSIAFFMDNFKFFGKSSSNVNDADKINPIFKNALLLVFGLSFSGVLVGWLAYMITNLSSGSGIFSFLLNLLLVVAILSLVYRLVIGTSLYKQPFFKLIINILFYIPCLFVGLIEGIVWFFGGLISLLGYTNGIQFTDGKTDTTSFIILVITILLFLVYLFRPSIENYIFKQGGNLLVNQPISTNELHPISDYLTLNQPSKTFDYQYGISFWFRMDADSPSTNASYKKYATLLNYGGKPNVLYNASTNTMIVTVKVKEEEQSMSSSPSSVLSNENNNKNSRDENGDLIVFTKTNVLLQKWNHVAINYSGGTLDIFYNGELAKSVYGIVPYMEYDALTVGQQNGVRGQLCNLNYFNKNMNLSQIYYLYNFVKNKDPPVSYDKKENIIKQPKHISDNIHGSFEVSNKKVEQVVDELQIATNPSKISKLNPVDPENYLSLKWYFAQQGDDFGMP